MGDANFQERGSLFPSIPSGITDAAPDRFASEGWKRLPCRCYAEWTGERWQIAASSFLCGHKQGEAVGRPRPDYDPHIDHPERFKEGPI